MPTIEFDTFYLRYPTDEWQYSVVLDFNVDTIQHQCKNYNQDHESPTGKIIDDVPHFI